MFKELLPLKCRKALKNLKRKKKVITAASSCGLNAAFRNAIFNAQPEQIDEQMLCKLLLVVKNGHPKSKDFERSQQHTSELSSTCKRKYLKAFPGCFNARNDLKRTDFRLSVPPYQIAARNCHSAPVLPEIAFSSSSSSFASHYAAVEPLVASSNIYLDRVKLTSPYYQEGQVSNYQSGYFSLRQTDDISHIPQKSPLTKEDLTFFNFFRAKSSYR